MFGESGVGSCLDDARNPIFDWKRWLLTQDERGVVWGSTSVDHGSCLCEAQANARCFACRAVWALRPLFERSYHMGGMPLKKDFTQLETAEYNKLRLHCARICIASMSLRVEHAGLKSIGPHNRGGTMVLTCHCARLRDSSSARPSSLARVLSLIP